MALRFRRPIADTLVQGLTLLGGFMKDLYDIYDRVVIYVPLGVGSWEFVLNNLPDNDEVTRKIRKAVSDKIKDQLPSIFQDTL